MEVSYIMEVSSACAGENPSAARASSCRMEMHLYRAYVSLNQNHNACGHQWSEIRHRQSGIDRRGRLQRVVFGLPMVGGRAIPDASRRAIFSSPAVAAR